MVERKAVKRPDGSMEALDVLAVDGQLDLRELTEHGTHQFTRRGFLSYLSPGPRPRPPAPGPRPP